MVASCCVVGCRNTLYTKESLRFFRFPTVRTRYCIQFQNILAARRKAWIKAVNRKNVSDGNVDNLKICCEHFISGEPAHFRDTLHPDWIPSVRMGFKQPDKLSPQKKLKRYARALKRNQKKSNPKSSVQSSTESIEGNQINSQVVETSVSDTVTSLSSAVASTVISHIEESVEIENTLPNDVTVLDCNFNEQDPLAASVDCPVTEEIPSVAEIENTLPNDVTVLDCNLNEQDPLATSVDCSVTKEFPSVAEIESLHKEIASLRVQLIVQRSEIETKNEEISCLKEQNASLNLDLADRCRELYDLRLRVKRCELNEDAFVNDDKKLNYFTGIPNLKLFNLLLKYVGTSLEALPVKKLSSFQKLLLTFMKLRTNITFVGLGYRFDISTREASSLFQQIIIILENTFSYLVHWPDRDNLRAKIPNCFREKFGDAVSVVIDCFEIAIERPGNVRAKAQTFSNYKHKHTAKYLLGITPHGFISFISDGWGGRVSDKKITEECGILDNLLPGDIVLADRGFTINELVTLQYAKLNIPEFTRGKKQLHPKEIEKTRKIASVRIHVERVIAMIRGKFQILKGPIPVTVLKAKYNGRDLLDSIVKVCCILINLCESVIPSD